jgi:hypothetical protein
MSYALKEEEQEEQEEQEEEVEAKEEKEKRKEETGCKMPDARKETTSTMRTNYWGTCAP